MDRGGDGRVEMMGVTSRLKLDQEHAIWKEVCSCFPGEALGQLDTQPRFPNSAWTYHGQHPAVRFFKQIGCCQDIAFPADEGCWLRREVMALADHS